MRNTVTWLCVLIAVICFGHTANGLENGLALTPPMGFMTWQRFRCITDCDLYPDECISEWLIKRTTDLMVANGYKKAGYEYVIIDDCWLEMERDPVTQEMLADRKRFPSGIKALADYVHKSGLKLGIYQDYGTHTCAGYPGVIDHMELDANTFARWEVDYIKLDGCYAETDDMDKGYPEFGRLLNATGRPIVYSCSWPAYQEKPNYAEIKKHCNLWRNGGDIQDSYSSLRSVIEFFEKNQLTFQPLAGSGHWNDPDMLLIGNFGLSIDQSKMQMALWAILAAPLLMSTDLKNIRPEFEEILLNKRIIAVNQDALGIQGLLLKQDKTIEFWVRPISPIVDKHYTYAVAIISKRNDGAPFTISYKPADFGVNCTHGYLVEDLYDIKNSFKVRDPNQELTARVNPSGVVFYKFIPLKPTNMKLFKSKSIIKIMNQKSIYENEILPQIHNFEEAFV